MSSADRVMTPREYVHLHNRAGFGLRPGELPSGRYPTRREAVDELLNIGDIEPARPTSDRVDQNLTVSYPLRSDWLKRMSHPGRQALLERMTLFWHDHFACLPIRENIAYRQLNLLRREGLGDFRSLATGMATDVAMMRYLDAVYITREAPNENFAREILELFTVGLEGYTEADVRGLAKSLAGWGIDDRETFSIHKDQLDPGPKTIFGTTRAFGGEEAVAYAASQPQTARFLTDKLWRYLTDQPPGVALTDRLARVLYGGDFAIGPWVRALLLSDEFYADGLIGRKIKSPIDLLVMWTRHVGADLPDDTDRWVNFTRFNGQFLFAPPSVAGWPGGRSWLNSSSVSFRMALPSVAAGARYEKPTDLSTFEGLAGYAAAAVERCRRDGSLARRMLNVEADLRDAVALANHSTYQYA